MKVTFSLKKLLKSWFHEKNFQWERENFSFYHTACYAVMPRFFSQKFRQINVFTKELYCKLIWRKNFQVGENFWNFHTEQCEKTRNSLSQKKISWNQLFSTYSKTVAFTKFLSKNRERFLHCAMTAQCGNLIIFPPRFFEKIPSNQLFN